MARTFETSTATSRLGMDDPDHKSQVHDLACQYLAQEPLTETIVGILSPRFYEIVPPPTMPDRRHVTFERKVIKGTGQYASVVGFVDLAIGYDFSGQTIDGKTARESFTVAFEVKTSPCAIGEIIRQIGLYREYCTKLSRSFWILATTFAISSRDAEMLASDGIIHVRLGSKFEEFQKNSQTSESQSREI